MQYRPFWWSYFHPDLTGGLIGIIAFLAFMAIANIVGFINAVASGGPEAFNYIVPVIMYGLPVLGLIRLKRWARTFEIVYSLLMVALGFFLMIAASIGMGAFIIVTHGLVAFYLLSEKCRRLFYPPPADPR